MVQNKKGHVKKNDILVVKDGATTGKVSFFNGDFPHSSVSVNEHVFRIEVNNQLIDPLFCFYYLTSDFGQKELLSDFRGATVGGISKEILDKVTIPLPPLPEQKRIAAILDKADALRRKDEELLKKYDELAQSIFIDMFGDPVKNEKGWEVKRLNELGTLDRGVSKHRPRNAPELLGGAYPLIQTGDVSNSGGVITSYCSTYSDIGLKQSKLWPKGTLCITIAANIAKTGVLDFDACFPDSVVGFLPYKNESNSIFIQVWLSFLQKTLEDTAPESAQKNINLEILRNLSVIKPPIEWQNKYKTRIDHAKKIKNLFLQSKRDSSSLFQSLLQQAFKGGL